MAALPITPRSGYHKAGIATQGQQDIGAPPEAIVTGDYPPLSGIDFPMEENQTLEALSVVGLNRFGRLVMATSGPPGIHARSTLTLAARPGDGETVTIDGVVYRYSDALNAANRIARGANAASSAEAAQSLAAAINDDRSVPGQFYEADHVAHPTVSASAVGGTVIVVARQTGAQGNAIAVAEALVNGGSVFAPAGNLGGGAGGIQPIGVMPHAMTAGAGERPVVPIHPTGVFNPKRLNWHPSFHSDFTKRMAFIGAPAPTSVMIREVRVNTV